MRISDKVQMANSVESIVLRKYFKINIEQNSFTEHKRTYQRRHELEDPSIKEKVGSSNLDDVQRQCNYRSDDHEEHRPDNQTLDKKLVRCFSLTINTGYNSYRTFSE